MPFHKFFSLSNRLRACAGALAVVVVPALSASAQAVGRSEQLETRAALTERANREEAAGHKGAAAGIRARLADGDFQEGDRVVVELENNPGTGRGDAAGLIRPDTLPVRAGRVLQFPQGRYEGVADLKVGGLLRSEIADSVRAHFAKTYRNPQMRVIPLVAVTVSGAVLRPGVYDVAYDIRLNDVLTAAGGWAADANLDKVTIIRGTQKLMDGKQVRGAFDNGLTVDNVQLRAGDQIMVPRKSNSNWLTYAGFGMSVLTVILALTRVR